MGTELSSDGTEGNSVRVASSAEELWQLLSSDISKKDGPRKSAVYAEDSTNAPAIQDTIQQGLVSKPETPRVDLTPKQEVMAERAEDYALSRKSTDYFLGSGLAGTGKTTTMVEIIRRLKASGVRPCVVAPTGKAAHVINSKQSEFKAMTIHKALTKHPYDNLAEIHRQLDVLEAVGKSRELTEDEKQKERELFCQLEDEQKASNLSFEPIEPEMFGTEYDVLVVDEASMVGRDKIYDLLIEHLPTPKMFFGDGAQLPPVKDVQALDFGKPNAELTEILRQGKDSGILQFAHSIHRGKMLTARQMGEYADLTVIKDHNTKCAIPFCLDHQIIVWQNKERHKLNPIIRKARGFNFDKEAWVHRPMVGETLMVDENDDGRRLLKGQLLKVLAVSEMPGYVENPYLCNITVPDGNTERSIPISLTDMVGPETLLKGDSTRDDKARRTADKVGVKMMYSYCITAHKAQGSEWDKVFVLGSMQPGAFKDWKKWWYTAVTRAKSSLVVASYHFTHDR